MMPLVSRSDIVKKLKELKEDFKDDYDSTASKRVQKRFNHLIEERSSLQKPMEDNFFTLMKDSKLPPLEYVKALSEIDSELPGKNPYQFEQLLQYFWNRVAEYVYDFQEALDALCNAFPNYERVTLKSAYLAFADGFLEADYDFTVLLERMYDFDQIEGVDHFTSYVDEHLPDELHEPVINICDSVEEIFGFFDLYTPLYDIMWLLENRFGVDREYMERLAYDKMCEIYPEYDLKVLMMNSTIEQFFRLHDGYALFFMFLPTIMRNSYPEEGYGDLLRYCFINLDIKASEIDELERIAVAEGIAVAKE